LKQYLDNKYVVDSTGFKVNCYGLPKVDQAAISQQQFTAVTASAGETHSTWLPRVLLLRTNRSLLAALLLLLLELDIASHVTLTDCSFTSLGTTALPLLSTF
jgi:hypothetical protein